jgi:hypothetical protein
MAKAKKFIFPGITLIISLYISALFAVGIISGYICTILFHKKLTQKGRLKPIVLRFGKWKFHLHHWVMGGLALFSLWLGGGFPLLPEFCLGMLGGLVFHDIYSDREWYKIISRK